MKERAHPWGRILLSGALAASCQTAEPADVEHDAPVAAAPDGGAGARSTSLEFQRVFRSGSGGTAPKPSDVNGFNRWLPQVKALAVGPGDDIWIAGTFFAPLQLGSTDLTSAGGGDVFVLRLDPQGNLRWARQVGGPEDDNCGGLAVDAEGNAIVARPSPERGPVTLTKLGADGDRLWQKTVPLVSREGNQAYFAAAAADRAGGLLLSSKYDGEIMVTRVDPNGDTLWKVGSLPGAESWPVEMATDGEGNAVIGEGSTVGPAIRLLKVWASGTAKYNRRYRGHGEAIDFYSIGASLRGDILLSGFGGVELGGIPTAPENRNASWIARLDPSGNPRWQTFGTACRLAADDAGNVLCANFGAVGKLDASGAWIWRYSPRIDGHGTAAAVTADSAGRVIYAGTFTGRVDFGDGPVESGTSAALFVTALAP